MPALNAVTFDVERLAQIWAKSVTGLVGGNLPLIGVHLVEDARSPQRGAIAVLRVGAPRTVDRIGDAATINWEVKAASGEQGGKATAERGAQALADALRELEEIGFVIVSSTGPRAETAKLSCNGSVQGPTSVGFPGGQATYRVDSPLLFQAL